MHNFITVSNALASLQEDLPNHHTMSDYIIDDKKYWLSRETDPVYPSNNPHYATLARTGHVEGRGALKIGSKINWVVAKADGRTIREIAEDIACRT